MWEGLTGKRRKNGLYGMTIGIVVSAILLYLSFYIQFLFLLIPVLLVVIFHYTKAWRFSDRAFYGFFAILVAFFIAMGGISSSFTDAPHHSTSVVKIGSVTYDIKYYYSVSNGSYIFNFSMPIYNATNATELSLINLNSQTVVKENGTFTRSNGNYSLTWNVGQLPPSIYVVNMTVHVLNNSKLTNTFLEFSGPVLLSSTSIFFLLVSNVDYVTSYLAITFLFFLAFAFFARAISTSRQRKSRDGGQNPPNPAAPLEQPIIDTGQQKKGWFGRRRY